MPGRYDSYTYFNPPSHPDELLFKAAELKESQAIADQQALKERLGKLHQLPINEGNLQSVTKLYEGLKDNLTGLVKKNEALNDPLVGSSLNDKISSFTKTPEFITATTLGAAKLRDDATSKEADKYQQDYLKLKWQHINSRPVLSITDPFYKLGVSSEEHLKPQNPEKTMIEYLGKSKLKFNGLTPDGRFILEKSSTNLPEAITGARASLNPEEQKSLYYRARVLENTNPQYVEQLKEMYGKQLDKVDPTTGKVIEKYPRDNISLEDALTFEMAARLAPNLMEDKVKAISDPYMLLKYKQDLHNASLKKLEDNSHLDIISSHITSDVKSEKSLQKTLNSVLGDNSELGQLISKEISLGSNDAKEIANNNKKYTDVTDKTSYFNSNGALLIKGPNKNHHVKNSQNLLDDMGRSELEFINTSAEYFNLSPSEKNKLDALNGLLAIGVRQGLKYIIDPITSAVKGERTDKEIIDMVARSKFNSSVNTQFNGFYTPGANEEKYVDTYVVPEINSAIKGENNTKVFVDDENSTPINKNDKEWKTFALTSSNSVNKNGWVVSGPILHGTDGFMHVTLSKDGSDNKFIKIKTNSDPLSSSRDLLKTIQDKKFKGGYGEINNNSLINTINVKGVEESNIISFPANPYESLAPMLDNLNSSTLNSIGQDLSKLQYNEQFLKEIADLDIPQSRQLIKSIKKGVPNDISYNLKLILNNNENPLGDKPEQITSHFGDGPESTKYKTLFEILVNNSPNLHYLFDSFVKKAIDNRIATVSKPEDFAKGIYEKTVNDNSTYFQNRRVTKPVTVNSSDYNYNNNYNDDNNNNDNNNNDNNN